MTNFKQMTDQRLNALTWNVDEGMRALREKAAPKPRRTLRPALALAMVMVVLMGATALAVGLRMSQKVDVERIAREAVMEAYGLDARSLGMLSETSTEENGVWTVTYGGNWKVDQVGVYTVTVQPDGTAQVSWSMEGKPDAWTQADIAAYADQKEEIYRQQLEDPALNAPSTAEPIPTPTPVPGAKLTHEAAITAAREALKNKYGFTELGMSPFYAMAEYKDGTWEVKWTASSWRWPDGYLGDRAGNYFVWVDDKTGNIDESAWTLADVDPNTYTPETLGSAVVYDAQCMEWVAAIIKEREAIYAANDYENIPGQLPPEVLAQLDQMMIDAGFDPAKYNHVVPGEGDIPLDEAMELAAQAVMSQYGVSREIIDGSVYAYADLTQEAIHRQWYFWIQSNEAQMDWMVTIDAQTGVILDMIEESYALGNG